MIAENFRENAREGSLDAVQYIQAILLAMILNMNAIKLVMRSQSNLFTYFIFAAFAASVMIALPSFEEIYFRLRKDLAFSLFLFGAVSLAELAFSSRGGYETLVKFAAGICIGCLAGRMKRRTVIATARFSVLFSTIYALYIQGRYSSVLAYIKNREMSNYLVVTLPLGLSLTLALVLLILIDRKGPWRRMIGDIAAGIILFATLTRFSARGNLLFPFAVAAVLLVYINRRDLSRLLLSMLLIVVLGALVYFLVLQMGDEKLINRLARLFQSTENENRSSLYQFYLDYILKDFRWVTGIGFGNSKAVLASGGLTESYPHNFILELIGELGLIGLLLLAVTGRYAFLQAKKHFHIFLRTHQEDPIFVLYYAIVHAGLLFYLMTFFKSYSIYDGYPLFIFLGFLYQNPDAKEGAASC